MSLRTFSIAIVTLLVFSGMAIAQQGQGSAKLLLSFQKVNTSRQMETTAGGVVRSYDTQALVEHDATDSLCLLVYGDGSYYYENMSERAFGKSKIKAANGNLKSADIEQLQSITADPAFREISSPPAPAEPDDATYLKGGEVVKIAVARQDAIQRFNLVRKRYARQGMSGMDAIVSNWSGAEKTLKPLLSWVKNIEKTTKSGLTDSKATGCPSSLSAN